MSLKARGEKKKRQLVPMVVLGLGMLFIWSMWVSLTDLLSLGSRVESMEEEVAQMEERNRQLREKLEQVKKPEVIEKMIRDELGLVQEGEAVVIVPEGLLREEGEVKSGKGGEGRKPVWKKWVDLFL